MKFWMISQSYFQNRRSKYFKKHPPKKSTAHMVSKPDWKSDVARTILETEFKFNSFIIVLIEIWFYF